MANTLHVATRKGLFTFNRKGDAWQPHANAFLGVPVSAVHDDGETIFAALNHGHFGDKLHRSDDRGKTWIEVAVPEYPELPEGAEPDKCPMRGIDIPWKLNMIWTLNRVGNELWAGTLPGGLFRSNDKGQTWSLVESLWNQPARKKWMGGGYDFPGIHSICPHADDPKRVAVGVSCGGVWQTEDGGASWRCDTKGIIARYMPPDLQDDPEIQDPHLLTRCAKQPDKLWVQHHNGIFRSADGGATWNEIMADDVAAPSTFGFAVAVHPHDGDTAWFVPAQKDEMRIPVDAKFVVTRTRDGGKTMDVITKGLPDEPAYHIVYRHALAVDETGETLAMGSTTGGLWTSSDGGDSWQCATQHLPMVLAVQFA